MGSPIVQLNSLETLRTEQIKINLNTEQAEGMSSPRLLEPIPSLIDE
jgi:hypothetical protein